MLPKEMCKRKYFRISGEKLQPYDNGVASKMIIAPFYRMDASDKIIAIPTTPPIIPAIASKIS